MEKDSKQMFDDWFYEIQYGKKREPSILKLSSFSKTSKKKFAKEYSRCTYLAYEDDNHEIHFNIVKLDWVYGRNERGYAALIIRPNDDGISESLQSKHIIATCEALTLEELYKKLKSWVKNYNNGQKQNKVV
jgi:hypothetical protein